jgi:hypothetical protein
MKDNAHDTKGFLLINYLERWTNVLVIDPSHVVQREVLAVLTQGYQLSVSHVENSRELRKTDE